MLHLHFSDSRLTRLTVNMRSIFVLIFAACSVPPVESYYDVL